MYVSGTIAHDPVLVSGFCYCERIWQTNQRPRNKFSTYLRPSFTMRPLNWESRFRDALDRLWNSDIVYFHKEMTPSMLTETGPFFYKVTGNFCFNPYLATVCTFRTLFSLVYFPGKFFVFVFVLTSLNLWILIAPLLNVNVMNCLFVCLWLCRRFHFRSRRPMAISSANVLLSRGSTTSIESGQWRSRWNVRQVHPNAESSCIRIGGGKISSSTIISKSATWWYSPWWRIPGSLSTSTGRSRWY